MSQSSNNKPEAPQEQFTGRLATICMMGLIVAGYVCIIGRRVADLDLVTLGSLFMELAFWILMGYSLADTREPV